MKRQTLRLTLLTMAMIGLGFASVPFLKSLGYPAYLNEQNNIPYISETISLNGLKAGEYRTIHWNRMIVGVYKRTNEEIAQFSRMSIFVYDPFSSEQIPSPYWSKHPDDYKGLLVGEEKWVKTAMRSIKKEYFVYSLISPTYSCVLKINSNSLEGKKLFPRTKPKGFYDPCSNASFDLAGRIYINDKYKHHMFIPNHRYIGENTIEFIPNE